MTVTTIHIDNRERDLKKYAETQQNTDKFAFSNLEHGDIHICVSGDPLMIIERKTIADLAASIKDGRYKNQKARLLATYPRSALYYVIEGSVDYMTVDTSQTTVHGISIRALKSCIINTMVRDDIKVVITKNAAETFAFIESVYSRIVEDPDKYTATSSETVQTVQTATEVTIISSKCDTAAKCYENQLCQVPDVSAKTAKAIMNWYPSLKEMYEALGKLSDEEKAIELMKIRIQSGGGDTNTCRRISERVVNNIIRYMLG